MHQRAWILPLAVFLSSAAGCLGGASEEEQVTLVLDRVEAGQVTGVKPTVLPEAAMEELPAPFQDAAAALREAGSAEARLRRSEADAIYARVDDLAEGQGSSRSLLSYRDVPFQMAMLSH